MAGYRVSLGYFRESCEKCFLEEIERKDLLRFAAFLRDTKKLAPRTVHNKFADVLTFPARSPSPESWHLFSLHYTRQIRHRISIR